jgi:hypothetical protein
VGANLLETDDEKLHRQRTEHVERQRLQHVINRLVYIAVASFNVREGESPKGPTEVAQQQDARIQQRHLCKRCTLHTSRELPFTTAGTAIETAIAAESELGEFLVT